MDFFYNLTLLIVGFFHARASLFQNVPVFEVSNFQKIKTEKASEMTECSLFCERMPSCSAVGWSSKLKNCNIFVQRNATAEQAELTLSEEYWIKDEQIMSIQTISPPQPKQECPLCFLPASVTHTCLEKMYWKHPYFSTCDQDTNFWLQTGDQLLNQYAIITTNSSGLSILTDITICFWIHEAFNHSGGLTSVHYGELSDTYCDDLALVYKYDTNRGYYTLHIIIMQYSVNTEQRINDGHLHHICFSWSSTYGNWHFYLDGVKMSQGTSFQQGIYIKTGGQLTFGRNKDRKAINYKWTCDGFRSKNNFRGEVSSLYFWNKILTENEINVLHSSCEIPYQDKLISEWKMEKVYEKNDAKKIKYCY